MATWFSKTKLVIRTNMSAYAVVNKSLHLHIGRHVDYVAILVVPSFALQIVAFAFALRLHLCCVCVVLCLCCACCCLWWW